MNRTLKAMAVLMVMMVFAVGCTKPDVEHEYVDLGLPSGTLWATCNIGATAPEGYGDYFAWGETKAKSVYNWEKYKYAKGCFDEYPLLTKYCTDDSYGNNGFVPVPLCLPLCRNGWCIAYSGSSGWRTRGFARN